MGLEDDNNVPPGELSMMGAGRAMAAAQCEHFYASHCYRGMSVRLCMTCHEPDWDDLEAQLSGATKPVPAADIVRYMRATGWAHGRQGSHGAMWTRGDVEFSVPHEDHNPAWLREVVGRLASAEGRTPEATAAAIAEYRDTRAATKPCGCGPLEPCGEHLKAQAPNVTLWRKRTPELEAMHWDGYPTTATVLIDWILAGGGTARYHDGPSALSIDIPGGTINAVPGDWIVRREDGVFWPWTEDEFADAHERATITAGAPEVTSAPAPAKPPTASTEPPAPVSEAAVQAALDAVALFWREAHAVLQAYPSAALARAMLEGAAPLIRADAEARLAEVRQTIAAFFTHHGNSAAFALQTARDLAEGIRQILDREGPS